MIPHRIVCMLCLCLLIGTDSIICVGMPVSRVYTLKHGGVYPKYSAQLPRLDKDALGD